MNKRKNFFGYLEDYLTTSFPYYAKTHGFIPKNFPYEPRINRIIGHTEQVKTEGYQILRDFQSSTGTLANVDFTRIADGQWYTFNGTASSNSSRYLSADGLWLSSRANAMRVHLEAGESVTISIEVDGGSVTTSTQIFSIRDYANDLTQASCSFVNRSVTFTATESIDIMFANRVANGTTYENFKFRQMAELGTVSHAFEPYTGGAPAPSPQYPQPLEDFYAGEDNPMRSIGNVYFDEIFRASSGYYYETRRVKKVTVTTSMATVVWNATHKIAYLRFPATDQMEGITDKVAAYCPVAYPVPSSSWSEYKDRYTCYGRTAGTAALYIDAPADMYAADNYTTFKTDMMALHPTIDFYYVPSSQPTTLIGTEEGAAAIAAYNHYCYDVVYYDHNYQFISSAVNNNYHAAVAAYPEGTAFYRLSMHYENPQIDITQADYLSEELQENMFVPGNILKTEPGRYSPVNGEPEENNYYIRTGAY